MTTWSSLTWRTSGNRFSRALLMLTAVTSITSTRTTSLYKSTRPLYLLPTSATSARGIDERGQAATHGDRRISVGHQRRDHRIAVDVANREQLESGCGQAAGLVWLVGREGWLPVAPAPPQCHAVRAGRAEDRILDVLGDGL